MMRKVIFSMLIALGLAFVGASGTTAAPLGSGGVTSADALTKVGYGYCSYLRYRCENKGELGEWGQGNCRRYKTECGGGVSRCEKLRRACREQREYGDYGGGACRRYRYECRDGGY
jgi:hypothetical protein